MLAALAVCIAHPIRDRKSIMPAVPSPLFDTHDRFLELNFQQLSEELPIVRD